MTEDGWEILTCGECDKPIEDGEFTSTYDRLVCHLNCAIVAMNNEVVKKRVDTL